ncbi:hypothetical protein GDO78_007548 [Eleutherodactylus coqui]|uniref:Uncharacterized protein n=1 Tax=Eleutherodactylus coqui TaxID=57060 RepID=A0A8J6FH91_ELECQ|nr:hypothetical protein GDO78_007548 [Eleutherodactylus coqui]
MLCAHTLCLTTVTAAKPVEQSIALNGLCLFRVHSLANSKAEYVQKKKIFMLCRRSLHNEALAGSIKIKHVFDSRNFFEAADHTDK